MWVRNKWKVEKSQSGSIIVTILNERGPTGTVEHSLAPCLSWGKTEQMELSLSQQVKINMSNISWTWAIREFQWTSSIKQNQLKNQRDACHKPKLVIHS